MLGNHEGLPPLTDYSEADRMLLKSMGRLKAGKDVSFRKNLIKRALERTDFKGRYWVEDLISNLTGDNGIESIPAHLTAFSLAWSLQEKETAKIIRDVNKARKDPFLGQVTQGLMAAAPEFGKRLMERRMNSDELYIRVALTHFFRRNPLDTFQMFVIDGVVRQLPVCTKMNAQKLSKACLERLEEEPIPEGIWGFLLVISGTVGRSGYFLKKPSEQAHSQSDALTNRLKQALGDLEPHEILHHAGAAFFSEYYQRGNEGMFQNSIAPFMERAGYPCGIFFAQEEEGGIYSNFIPIPSDNPEEARAIALQMPEVKIHDDLREQSEAIMQFIDQMNIVKS